MFAGSGSSEDILRRRLKRMTSPWALMWIGDGLWAGRRGRDRGPEEAIRDEDSVKGLSKWARAPLK